MITTNATVLPTPKMLRVLQACSDFIKITISQYHSVPDWDKKYESFHNVMISHDIPASILVKDCWISLWNRDTNEKSNFEHALKNYDDCINNCRLYTDYRLYYCLQAYGANQAIYHLDSCSESIDLRDENVTGMQLIEFLAGYSDRGCMEVCSLCKGSYGANTTSIPIAEQLP